MGYIRFLIDNRLFLLAGFLLSFTSSYGQTFFIGIFAGDIMRAFDLTDGQWGMLYTLSTSASAVAMIWAGALCDSFRVRSLSLWIMVLLAVACLGMTTVGGSLLLALVVFALRFLGQGMMSQIAYVAMARWFIAARGRAISLAAMGFSAGQAVLPVSFVALLALLDWRMLWAIAALLIITTIPIIQRLLRQERTPQSMAESSHSLGMKGRHWSRSDMLRHPLFYLFIPAMIGPAAWGTALFFQQVHLTEVKGWSLVSFVALLPIYTMSAIAFTVVAGWAVDRFGVKWVVPFQMIPFAIAFAVLAVAETIPVAGLGLVIFGVGQGIQSTATAAFWATFYGTRHLGSIKSAAAALMVFGSAIGPGLTGFLIDYGIDFPRQMVPISLFYLCGALLACLGTLRYHRDLPNAPA
ncbi:MFS transporter [uncultured Roseobacter sp.]|uniref:MFS transporter n=1 Tax=uncultured Roseobacter sp. TaxID=114847 RepID=UPI00261CF757|nr:MFS transporter [uncultured Roseobacter sp.]